MKTKKYTWKMLRKDFGKAYPDLSKKSNYWCPYDFMKIEICLNDGRRLVFDGLDKTINFVEPWKYELKKEQEASKKN